MGMFISRLIVNFTDPPIGCKLCGCSVWGGHFASCVKAVCPLPEITPTVYTQEQVFNAASAENGVKGNTVIRRHNLFWPSSRAKNIVKEILGPGHGRMTYDWNIKFIADKVGLPPHEVLATNPILIGRKLGLTDETLERIIDKYDYPRLLQ
jgi:hypothetical protein